jgi:hypothetical protein
MLSITLCHTLLRDSCHGPRSPRESSTVEALNDAVDRCQAERRHPSAIIATPLVTISDNRQVTDPAVNLLDGPVRSGGTG